MGGSSKKQTVGYKYYLGEHMVLCHGPIDNISRIQVGEKDAWLGTQAANGQVVIDEPKLFGGEGREGGIQGTIDVEFGGPSQGRNDYLQSQLGAAIPAHRGVAGVVLRKVYLGMSPYLKAWAFRAQRIHKRGSDGATQWNDGLAAILRGYDVAPVAHPVAWIDRGTDFFNIGASQETSGTFNNPSDQSWFSGWIDSVRITKGVARYTADSFAVPGEDFSPTGSGDPYWASVVTQLRFNGADGQTTTTCDKGSTVTMNGGAKISTDKFKFGGSSAYFDGINDWVKTQVGSSNQALGATYTVEAWVNINQYVTNAHGATVVSAGQLSTAGYDSGFSVFNQSIHQYQYDTTIPPVNVVGITGNIKFVPLNTWVHLAWVRNGTTGLAHFYINGELATGTPISLNDMNPAHIIRECLTDQDWGMGYLDSDIDDASFEYAASVLYAESFGMSLLWDRQITISEFIDEITRHIDASLYVSRTSGKFVLDLIRDDYIEGNLISLDESNISKVTNPNKPVFGELYNSVTVNYWDADTGKDGSVTVQDPAMSKMQGSTIATKIEYQGFCTARNATIAAQRDLRALSSPRLTCTIYTNSIAKDLNIGSPFKFSWSKWLVSDLVMRVVSIAFGDGKSNKIRITAIEDIFRTPQITVVSAPGSEWVDPAQPPVPVESQLATEAPYWELAQLFGQTNIDSSLSENNQLGYALCAAARSGSSVNARLWTDSGAGYTDKGPLDFCPVATLTSDITPNQTILYYEDDSALSEVVIGSYAQIGIGTGNMEIVRVDDIDAGLLTVTVGRGALDTTPRQHYAGDVIFFLEDFNGYDQTEYILGETIDCKILPGNSEGSVDISSAVALSVTMEQRAYKPYPPGQFKINSTYYPSTLDGLLTTTWVDRDRLQQTSGAIYDHTDGAIGPEAGTTYRFRGYLDGVLTTTVEPSTSGQTWTPPSGGLVRIEVDSKRDGIYSLQTAKHEFLYSAANGRTTEESVLDIRVEEDGDIRVVED